MEQIDKRKNDLVLLLLLLNLLFLVLSFFIQLKVLGVLIANIVFLAKLFILNKYGYLFETLKYSNKFIKSLNKRL